MTSPVLRVLVKIILELCRAVMKKDYESMKVVEGKLIALHDVVEKGLFK